MQIDPKTLAAFRAYRARAYGATEALALAVRTLDAGRAVPYAETAGIGAASDNGLQWVDAPEKHGLRFVGFSDGLSRVDHTGWYCNPHDFGDVMRGAVYQLPARNGVARYVAGYRQGADSKANGWQDMSGNHGARLDLRNIFEGDKGGNGYGATGRAFGVPHWDCNESAMREAGYRADSIAQTAAESEREWQEAFTAGQRCGELRESVAAARTAARALIVELRSYRAKVGDSFPAICDTLTQAIKAHRITMHADSQVARELQRDWEADANPAACSSWRMRKAELAESFREGLHNC